MLIVAIEVLVARRGAPAFDRESATAAASPPHPSTPFEPQAHYWAQPPDRKRTLLILSGSLLLVLAIAVGWWFLLGPPGFPAPIALLPCAPFLLAAAYCFSRAGLDRIEIPWRIGYYVPLLILIYFGLGLLLYLALADM